MASFSVAAFVFVVTAAAFVVVLGGILVQEETGRDGLLTVWVVYGNNRR